MSSSVEPSTFTSSVRTLYLALLIGMLSMVTVLGVLVEEPMIGDDPEIRELWLAITLAVFVLGIGGGHYYFSRLMETAQKQATLTGKLLTWRNAALLNYATAEGAFLVAAVGYFLTHHSYFFYPAIAALVYYVIRRPTRDRVIRDLDLDLNEQQALK